ncbi:MAG TPA: carboxylesterase family protein [Kofleriaceae bacterium]|nr:carboxylesterase family protein [Kofleriaceae bacterium]
MRKLVSMWVIATACGGEHGSTGADAARDATPPDADNVVVGTDVTIDSGPLHGMASGDLVEFFGVPYATAARWMAPAPPAAWTAPRDATAFGPACPQAGSTLPQSEACLLLNVWAHASGPHRPVLVWIHGGGYIQGSAQESQYDAAALADAADAVVVSIDYRLGVLGFLALPQLAAPDGGIGNYGIRDQIAALEWVKRNIATFGGDPSRVMIVGESAGGAAVCTLAAAPGAQGLFAAAAIESGPCQMTLELTTMVGSFPSAEGYGAVAIAVPLGCTSGDIATCLRGKTVDQILALDLPQYWDLGLPVYATLPVVDGVVLDQRPLAALATRGQVPLIVGSNLTDASVFIYAIGVADTAGAFDAYLAQVGQSANQAALDALYPVATLGERDAAIEYATDVAFACGAAWQIVQARTAPTYLYELERAVPNGPEMMYGSVHGYDFVNLFGTFSTWGITPGAADLATSADVQAQWAAIAHGDVPSTWPAATGATPRFRQLDDPPATGTTWRGGRCPQLAALGVLGH